MLVIGWIADAIFGWFGGIVSSWFAKRADQQAGANKANAAVTAQSEKTESAIAQAEANAPKSDIDVLKRLTEGSA